MNVHISHCNYVYVASSGCGQVSCLAFMIWLMPPLVSRIIYLHTFHSLLHRSEITEYLFNCILAHDDDFGARRKHHMLCLQKMSLINVGGDEKIHEWWLSFCNFPQTQCCLFKATQLAIAILNYDILCLMVTLIRSLLSPCKSPHARVEPLKTVRSITFKDEVISSLPLELKEALFTSIATPGGLLVGLRWSGNLSSSEYLYSAMEESFSVHCKAVGVSFPTHVKVAGPLQLGPPAVRWWLPKPEPIHFLTRNENTIVHLTMWFCCQQWTNHNHKDTLIDEHLNETINEVFPLPARTHLLHSGGHKPRNFCARAC